MSPPKIFTHVLTLNNEKTIARLLDSLTPLGCDVLCVDLGSSDKTVEICYDRNVAIQHARGQKDMASVRNRIVETAEHDWQLYLEPWEVLVDNHLLTASKMQLGGAYSLRIVTGEMVNHEVRFWNRTDGFKFKNPVYEHLDVPDAQIKPINCSIYSDGSKSVSLERILEWKQSSPALVEPCYYEALYHLGKGDWNGFIASAMHYLFNRKLSSQSSIMMKYYLAIALCHIEKNANEAIKHILECIAVKPLMAEFWCLLGDVHYHLLREYKKAHQYYRNAMTLGSYRLSDDPWPMELAKYNKYPQKMLGSCEKLIEANRNLVQVQSSSGGGMKSQEAR